MTELMFYVPQEEGVLPEGQDDPLRTRLRVIFQTRYYEDRAEETLYNHDMLFAFKDVSNFEEMVNRWINVHRELKTFCNLFFGAQHAPAKYIDSQFLISAQALEIYRRLRCANTVLPAQEHRARKDIIIEHVPEEYRNWVNEQLAFSNEPRLLHRVEELLGLTEDIVLPIVKDRGAFARKVKNTRNYYTHYNADLQRRAATGVELYWVNQALFFLLQRCLLHELGFSPEQCDTLFRRNQRYINTLGQAHFSWEQAQ